MKHTNLFYSPIRSSVKLIYLNIIWIYYIEYVFVFNLNKILAIRAAHVQLIQAIFCFWSYHVHPLTCSFLCILIICFHRLSSAETSLWVCGWIWWVFLNTLRIRTQFHSPVEARPVKRQCEIYANSARIVPETRREQTHQSTATRCRPEPLHSCWVSELTVSNLTLIFLLMPWARCHRHQRCACVCVFLSVTQTHT